jgi:hypothetical protein
VVEARDRAKQSNLAAWSQFKCPSKLPAGKFLSKFPLEKWCRISIPRSMLPKPSHAEVDCGVVEERNQVGRTNLARWLQFGYG